MVAKQEQEYKPEGGFTIGPFVVAVIRDPDTDGHPVRKILTSDNFLKDPDLGEIRLSQAKLEQRLQELKERKTEVPQKKQKHGSGLKLSKSQRIKLYEQLSSEEAALKTKFADQSASLKRIETVFSNNHPATLTVVIERSLDAPPRLRINPPEEEAWWNFIKSTPGMWDKVWRLYNTYPETLLFVQEGFVRKVRAVRAARMDTAEKRTGPEQAFSAFVQELDALEETDREKANKVSSILVKGMKFINQNQGRL